MLAKYFGVAPADLDASAIADPHKAVAVDVAALKANPLLPEGLLVTGLLYDTYITNLRLLDFLYLETYLSINPTWSS